MLKIAIFKNKKIVGLAIIVFLLAIGQYHELIYNHGDLYGVFSAPKDPNLKFNFKFTDTTDLLGIEPYSKKKFSNLDPSFIAVGDINNDGFEDAIFVSVNNERKSVIDVQINKNGQRYEKSKLIEEIIKSFKPGVRILSLALVDLDNDGFEDLVVSYNKNCAGFYKNINGNFSNKVWKDVCSSEGDMAYIHIADINNDGFVDIYFASLLPSRKQGFYPIMVDNGFIGGKNILVINQGGKSFEDKTDEFGIIDFGTTWTAAMADYNNDGFVDIIDINDMSYNRYFENVGGKKFVEKTKEMMKQTERSYSMSGEVADFDRDGSWGTYVTNVTTKTRLRYGFNSLWKKAPNGNFQNEARKLKIDSCGYSWGARALEPERNGELSLVVVNAPMILNHLTNVTSVISTSNAVLQRLSDWNISKRAQRVQEYASKKGRFIAEDDAKLMGADGFITKFMAKDAQRNCFYTRVKGEYFDISENVGIVDERDGRTVVETDFNNDGVSDLFLGNIDGTPIMYTGSYSGANDWVGFKLKGNTSNRGAIGSIVELEFEKYKLKKQIFPTNGYQSLSTKRLVFGVNKSEKIKNISIKWPSGKMQIVSNYQLNKYNEINEN